MIQWKIGDPLTDEDRALLAPLIERARQTGLTPTVREIPTSPRIKSRFRLWKYAVMAANLPALTSPDQVRMRQEMYRLQRENEDKETEDLP